MISLKSESDLKLMRKAGSILAGILQELEKFVKVGMATEEIDQLAEKRVRENDAQPAFKGYRGYPASVCISINEEIVHGIPGSRKLKDGDLISLDLGLNYRGFFTDAAISVALGKVDSQVNKLIRVTEDALWLGIKEARVENRLQDISYAIQQHVEKNGFSVVRQFVGHGIGRSLHEDPEIPNYGLKHQGPELKSGMVLAIEPMVNMGTWESEILEDGWTAVTKDRLPSAHFEHTVVITSSGPEVLTGIMG